MSDSSEIEGDYDIGNIDLDQINAENKSSGMSSLGFDIAKSNIMSSINSIRTQLPDIQGSIHDITKDALSTVEVHNLQSDKKLLEEKVASLESEMRILEKTARHAKELEIELDMLSKDVSDLVGGVRKRGWLSKWHDTTKNSFIPKWTNRFFLLQGSTLSYGSSDADKSPWRTINLQHCKVTYEGTKQNGKYYVFAIYYVGIATFDNPDISILDPSFDKSLIFLSDVQSDPSSSSLLIRLSCADQAETEQWLELIHRAIIDSSRSASLDLPEGSTFLSKSPKMDSAAVTSTSSSSSSSTYSSTNNEIQKLRNDKKLNRSDSSTPQTKKTTTNDDHKTKSHAVIHFPSSMPIHLHSASSFLSSSSKNRQIHHYHGLIVLGVIVLVTNHFRLIIENLRLYGVLFQIPFIQLVSSPQVMGYVLSRFVLMNGFILATYLIEKTFCRSTVTVGRISLASLLHVIVITASIFTPLVLEYFYEENAIFGMIFLFISTIIWMKQVSYAHCNADLRRVGDNDDQLQLRIQSECNVHDTSSLTIILYPNNLTVNDMYYFMLAPTLSYQLNYPRMKGPIRYRYILSILIRMVVCSGLILLFVEQYVIPTVEVSAPSIHDNDIMKSMELLFSLAIPSTYIWLLGFYLFFHLYLNLIAELLQFGDRMFYKDWWNAKSIETFWRYWNLPVHHWFVRHIYFPAIRFGISKTSATFIIFLLSAIFHEVIISIPFRTVKVYAFLGMLAQAPLVVLASSIEKWVARVSSPAAGSVDSTKNNFSVIGNSMFWVTFCILGQPMAVMLYYYDFWIEAHNRAVAAKGFSVPLQTGDDL